jgi:uncharacterized protein YecE (DUF72 family)
MGIVYAGTSGWAYPAWKPSFYPAKLASAKFLGYYASRLNSTEVNYTFRRFPTEKLLAGWAEATPAGFKFAIKAHQSITHIKRLKEAADSTTKFIAALEPLHDANKLGPVLFQLPPFLKCDAARLKNFLGELPKGRQVAFEFRDASWFNEEVFGLLRGERGAVRGGERETGDAERQDRGLFLSSLARSGKAGIGQGSKRVARKGERLKSERRRLLLFQARR